MSFPTVPNCSYPFDTYVPSVVFAVLATLLMILFYWYISKLAINRVSKVSLICVMVGGFSNILPRFFGLCVKDYIHFLVWYINLGDILVVIGIIVLALNIWIKKLR